MIHSSISKKYISLIVAIFLLKLIVIAIYVLHHPSEARYASIAMRMAITHNYLMPFFNQDLPFFGKPPLSFWASAISIAVLGINEFAARLPHLLALATVCFLVFCSVKKIYDKKTALASIIILISHAQFFTCCTA